MDKRAQIVTKLHILQAKSCRISEFVYLTVLKFQALRPSCDHICHGQNLVKFPKMWGHQSIFIAFQDSQDRMNDRGPLNATWPWPWHGQVALRKRRAKQLETAPRQKRSHWNSMSQGLKSAQLMILMALRCLNKWYACEIGYVGCDIWLATNQDQIAWGAMSENMRTTSVWFVFNRSVLGTSWDVELHWRIQLTHFAPQCTETNWVWSAARDLQNELDRQFLHKKHHKTGMEGFCDG
jgi:hypothetical protein